MNDKNKDENTESNTSNKEKSKSNNDKKIEAEAIEQNGLNNSKKTSEGSEIDSNLDEQKLEPVSKSGWASWSDAVSESITNEMPIYVATGHYDDVPKALPRRNFFSDMPDKGLFAGTAIVGFILIVAGKLSGFPVELVVFFSILAMVAYGIFSFKMQAVRLRLDRLGDNFYYLGFIFTLASISSALIQLKRDYDVNIIIDSFGIALFTTIMGIAGRVIFIQMRTEVDDLERAVRQELVASANELRGQLHASVRDFGNFRIGIQQTIRESLDNSLTQFKEMAEAIVGRLDQTFKNYNDRAVEFSTISDKMVTIGVSIEERLSKLELPSDAITKKLEGVVSGLDNAAKNFSVVVSAESQGIKGLQNVSESLIAINSSIAALDQLLKNHSQTITKINLPAIELANNIELLNKLFEKTELHFNAELLKFSSISQASSQLQKEIAEQLRESKNAVGEVQKAMAETAILVAKYVNN